MKKIIMNLFLLFIGTYCFGQIKVGATPTFVYKDPDDNKLINIYLEENIELSFINLFDGVSAIKIPVTGENSTNFSAFIFKNFPIGTVVIYSYWFPVDPSFGNSSTFIIWRKIVVLRDHLLEQTIFFRKL